MSTYIVGEYAVDGVEYVLAGNNIVITGSPSLPIINSIPTANINIVAGLGMSVNQVGQNVTVTNAGILGIQAGNNIVISGNVQNPTINAVIPSSSNINISAGVGINIGGSNVNPIISNTGVLQISAGSGIAVSGNNANITITSTGGGGIGNGNMSTLYNPIFYQASIGSFSSGGTFLVGTINIPLDAKPNSTAYLYMKGYSLNFFQPSIGNACENYIGISLNSSTDPVSGWIKPVWGIVAVNPTGTPDPQMPNPIGLYAYNTPNTLGGISAQNSTYSQFPVWQTLSNISPNDPIYIVWNDAYSGYYGSDLYVDCPILMYETA